MMNRNYYFISIFLLISGLSLADTTLIKNINGYTLTNEGDMINFEALKFTNDRIDAIYPSTPEDVSFVDKVINGSGKTVIPGLIDAHGHVGSYGLSHLRVDLVGALSESEAADRVLEFADSNPELNWILGRGWNQVLWEEGEFPTQNR